MLMPAIVADAGEHATVRHRLERFAGNKRQHLHNRCHGASVKPHPGHLAIIDFWRLILSGGLGRLSLNSSASPEN